MNCQSCGNPLKPTDTFCTSCGCEVGNSSGSKKKKRSSRAIVLSILSLLIAAGVALGAYSFFSHRNADGPSPKEVQNNGSTVDLVLPDAEDKSNNNGGDMIVTFIIDGAIAIDNNGVYKAKDGVIFYYEGKADMNASLLEEISFDSVRAMLANRNHRMIVSIKPTANAKYSDVVKIVDEMKNNHIKTWQLEELTKEDSVIYERKLGHPIGK